MSGFGNEDEPGDPKSVSLPEPRGTTSKPEPHLDRAIQAQIGDRLRAMYGELIDQPVPDKLSSILSRLSGDAKD